MVPDLEALTVNNTLSKQILQFEVKNSIIQGSLRTRNKKNGI